MRIILIFLLIWQSGGNHFLEEQKKYPRVRNAIEQKLQKIKTQFSEKDIEFPPHKIFLRAFKQEELLQLWAKSPAVDTFCLVIEYAFCSSSGTPGPKRKQGDRQIPGGFYYIDRFNPISNFHLSLGINYPNR